MNHELLLQRIRVVLCRPSHPGNIGAVARAMKTMGIYRLALVAPKKFPDEEADTRASGAEDLLRNALVCDDLSEALAGTHFVVGLSARQRDLGPPVCSAHSAVSTISEEVLRGEVALVFGNETSGLSNDEIQRCHLAATIPTNPDFSSLNLGAAVQILCYECRQALLAEGAVGLAAGSRAATPFTSPMAEHNEVEGLLAHLGQAMSFTGFHNPEQPGRLIAKLRRLLVRSRLERDEVNILRGFLTSIETPTRHGRKRGGDKH